VHAEVLGVLLQLEVLVAAELQRLAVLAVGVAEGVLAVVDLVVGGPGEQRPVVALLQLDRVGARLGGSGEHPLALGEVALVVVADLRDDVAVARVVQGLVRDLQTAHRHHFQDGRTGALATASPRSGGTNR
jgi:hypothetical protein